MAAREKGAHIHTRTQCLSARRAGSIWHVELQREDGTRFALRAKALVNAAGPWVAQFIDDNLQQRSPYGIRLIQGSHIVVPRLYEGEQAYIMQNEDRRIVFAIPYMGRYTMIGTTDREHHGDPAQARISEEEIAYLLGVANAHFRKQLEREDILHTFTGVRPLCDDESDNPSVITNSTRRRCSRYSAASSPLIANWPRRRWRNSRPSSRIWADAGREPHHCLAAKT